MINKEKNILSSVTFFLLVFLNPLVVNSFHTLEDHNHHQHCCQNNSTHLVINAPDEFCLIHEYEFSVNDIPASGINEYSDNYFREMPVGNVRERPIEIFNNQTSPRAPPYFSLSHRG